MVAPPDTTVRPCPTNADFAIPTPPFVTIFPEFTPEESLVDCTVSEFVSTALVVVSIPSPEAVKTDEPAA